MNSPDNPPPRPKAFSRLHAKLQESLYGMRWTKLRHIQVETIHEVMDGDGDLIISARTAAGKTEAAFLPILSQIVDDEKKSVRAVYAGPLKALINDQFLRLERLCELAEIPVHKWHGDVGKAARKRLLEQPSGILLITPESIESLFVNHPHQLASLFSGLRYFVIDEAHSFLGNERGAHLRSLMTRLSLKSRDPVRRIGLSATLGDPEAARRWLRSADPSRVHLLEDSESKAIRIRLSGYIRPMIATTGQEPAEFQDDLSDCDFSMHSDIYRSFHGKSALIFGNRKDRIEECADHARRTAERAGQPNLFRIHHGSLSKGEREETEEALRSGQPIATFCSSTLEMGIDVGSVTSVGQIGPPWSVNSLAQRLGRSGRKEGEASEIRIFIEENEPGPHPGLLDRLFQNLLQSVAMTELMLSKWCEPPEVDRLHLSTLVQQILSSIAETGGRRADQLGEALIESGAFPTVHKSTFVQVLRSMGKADLIEQTPEGLIILGIAGEKIVLSRDFYMAFVVAEEYRVFHQGRHVGNVNFVPDLSVENYIILAGRRWKILDVDQERLEILVEPSPGGRLPRFEGQSSSDIHAKVRETMKGLLLSDVNPAYLDAKATEMLAQARTAALDAELYHRTFLQDGNDTIWFTWTGSRIQRTLSGLGRYLGGLSVQDEGIALTFERTTEGEVRSIFRSFLDEPPDVNLLASKFSAKTIEKYEPFLSDELQSHLFANHCLDLPGAMKAIAALV